MTHLVDCEVKVTDLEIFLGSFSLKLLGVYIS